eukprot:13448244-Ditylum_brightwellii.AAC.1
MSVVGSPKGVPYPPWLTPGSPREKCDQSGEVDAIEKNALVSFGVSSSAFTIKQGIQRSSK